MGVVATCKEELEIIVFSRINLQNENHYQIKHYGWLI